MTKEEELAQAVLTLTGGKENIIRAAHCMTRLRLSLADVANANIPELKKTPGVLGVLEADGQLQVVLGPGIVDKVAAAVNDLIGVSATAGQDLKSIYAAKSRTRFTALLRKLSGIFVPLIPAIVASGMIAGLTNMAIHLGADAHSTFVMILNALGWGLFTYLTIFVGINAAKEFGGTPAMGGLAGVLISNPAIGGIHLYGAPLVPGRGGIVGVLLVAYVLTVLEKRIRKFVPDAVDIIVTPALTLLIGGFATYFVLQPVGGVLSDGIVTFFKDLLAGGGPVAGYVLAATFLPVIMTGLHQGLTPVHMELLNTLKETPLLPILAMGGAGQVGATLAVYLKTRNQQLRKMIKGALPVGFLGIGEPLIFGVTLPLGRPFVTACIGAGFGGAWQAFTHTAAVAIGVSGLPLTFLIKGGQVGNYLVGLSLAYLGGFVVTWLAGFDDSRYGA